MAVKLVMTERCPRCLMTKEELREKLKAGKTMDELFHFTQGDGGLIFKAKVFKAGKEILYIPDIYLNDIPTDDAIDDDEKIAEILSCCYTGDDFLKLYGGKQGIAERVFWYCDWQHPSSVLGEGWPDDEEEQM